MAAIDDVLTWSQSLPSWQAEAVRRILGSDALTDKDHEDLFNLAKSELGLQQPPETLPIPPSTQELSTKLSPPDSVKLLAINNVQNVNLIKNGQSQPFAEHGITVIYGDNGAGKSGYVRILKLACSARDKTDRILPNIFAMDQSGQPSATLQIKIGNTITDVPWIRSNAHDPILNRITIFDGKCGQLIVDEQNEANYLPRGCEAFEKLADVVLRIKQKLEGQITPIPPIQDSAIAADTEAGTFLKTLSEKTTNLSIDSATKWTEIDDHALRDAEDLAKASDPSTAIAERTRVDKMKWRVIHAISDIAALGQQNKELSNELVEQTLQELAAASAARTAAMSERSSENKLPGVPSSNEWQILYNAAKKFSERLAYPQEIFPKTNGAVCVLCQQPLTEEASNRFAKFKRFMEDATNTTLEAARRKLNSVRSRFDAVSALSGSALEAICDDVATGDEEASKSLRAYHEATHARKLAVSKLLTEGTRPELARQLVDPPAPPEAELQKLARQLDERLAKITTASKPEEHKKLANRVTALRSRRALSLRRADVIDFVSKARRNAELKLAIAAMRTNEITKQGTNIIKKNLTPELITAMGDELRALGASRLPISIKPAGVYGQTTHAMSLAGANVTGFRVSEVLSEGETRVIAIAGFLAEQHLRPRHDAIVFDDPVSSLDHVFTRSIASRLAKEGLERQVIVFTHNIALLMDLQDAAEELAKRGRPVGVTVYTLRRAGNSAGMTTDGAPWAGMNVKQRTHHLTERLAKIKPLVIDDPAEYNERAAQIYGFLREAWESCIEDDLLSSVVCRHRNSVKTMELSQVLIEDDDVHQVDLNMTKASTWMTGHDKSKALSSNRPEPDEILEDIRALQEFSKKVRSRRDKVRERRKKQLLPAIVPETGTEEPSGPATV
jgi:energy-coupling factor transporter ATP-binding protein EcfA2